MPARAFLLVIILLLPFQARAAGYVVRPGDSLGRIALRFHVSVSALAKLNAIRDPDYVRAGQTLFIPTSLRIYGGAHSLYRGAYYRVHWGDTLLGIAQRFGIPIWTIRSMNPYLGRYPLAGQWLRTCSRCGASAYSSAATYHSGQATGQSTYYIVRAGDSLSGIAARIRVSPSALMLANRILNPNRVIVGSRLIVPFSRTPIYRAPLPARYLIASYAQRYGLSASLPLAIAWQESGFNQNSISPTGAVGVMQVEPYTARHIASLTGRHFNLYSVDDNVHAGVFWLASLLTYYGGNERLAAAAYYQGSRALAKHGLFRDTVRYVNNVMALKSSFGG